MSARKTTITRRQRLVAAALSGFIEGAVLAVFEWRNDTKNN